jgi:hypothetical protein
VEALQILRILENQNLPHPILIRVFLKNKIISINDFENFKSFTS